MQNALFLIDNNQTNVCQQGVFMYLSNLEEYGHLINAETFDTKHINPDVYELLTNRVDWEQRYISPLYPENLNPNKTADQVSARLLLHISDNNCWIQNVSVFKTC